MDEDPITHFPVLSICFQIEEDLNEYDDHANITAKHTWWKENELRYNTHFSTSSYAIDANTTFLV